MTAWWEEQDVTTEVTATLGENGGMTLPDAGQGLEYLIYHWASDEKQTGVIHTEGIVHTTHHPDDSSETVYDYLALDRVRRNIGDVALNLL